MIEKALKSLEDVQIIGEKSELPHINEVSIDSRTIKGNELFIALIADRNGHDFVTDAISKGSQAVLISEWRNEFETLKSNTTFFLVNDTLEALFKLAKWFRQNVLKADVIAITGSYAKTTVKEMTAAILQTIGDGLVTPGNFNNLIGVPLTLLNSRNSHKYGLFELAMNRYNEIAQLTRLVQPNIGLITHIGTSHLAFFGTKWGIAQAKHELFEEMEESAIRLYNLDDEFMNDYFNSDPYPNKVGYTFNQSKANRSNIIFAQKGKPDQNHCYEIEIEGIKIRSPLAGEHQMENILSAAVIAKIMNIPLREMPEALQKMQKSEVRNNIIQLGKVTLIRDEYNASRNSILAGLKLLKNISNGRKTIAVLGDVFELGEFTKEEHLNIAKDILMMNINEIYLVGKSMKYAYDYLKSMNYPNVYLTSEATDFVEEVFISAKNGAAILVKGSRKMKMENFSERFIAKYKNVPFGVK